MWWKVGLGLLGGAIVIGVGYKLLASPSGTRVGGGQKGDPNANKKNPPNDQTAHDWSVAVGGVGSAIGGIAKLLGNGQKDDSGSSDDNSDG